MCQTIEVGSYEEASRVFAQLLASGDFDGALGVAQCVWVFCCNEAIFNAALRGMMRQVSQRSNAGGTVCALGRDLRTLQLEHSRNFSEPQLATA
jgi:hypothetical protein